MADMIKVCPKCNSTDIRVEMGPMTSMGVPSPYVCENCGLMSYMMPEMERKDAMKSEVVKPEKVVHRTEVVDVSYGKFVISLYKILWKVMGPALLAISIYMIYGSLSSTGGQPNLYLGMIYLPIGLFVTVFAYLVPDRMSDVQKRNFGLSLLAIAAIAYVVFFYFEFEAFNLISALSPF
jgi:hypothetical protein